MNEERTVLDRMKNLLDGWEAVQDRRLIFLSCYKMMTQNILAAVEAQDFEDPSWVSTLMENFAEYYFRALEAYESDPANPPKAWRIAFVATQNPRTHVMQNMVLGMNAHINYDLVFVLSDLLALEWGQLSAEQRKMRYRDHCHVNDIIYHTIDAVQDQVVDRFDPELDLVDKVLGPLDEWMTSLIITEWREEVWEHAIQMLDLADPAGRQAILDHVEHVAIARAQDILGKGGLSELFEFI